MSAGRIVLRLIGIGLLGSTVGCVLTGNKPSPFNNAWPSKSANVHSGPAITAYDKEALLKNAGPVDDDAPSEFSETTSGLKYRILRKSDGRRPTDSNRVTVNYRGWLDNGTEFDSSYKRGEPLSFPLTGVIPGWTEGMQLVGKGGMVELWIPPRLGYGSAGAGASVPPNATLHFIVELIDVK